MAKFPIDTESRRIGSRACAIVHYQFNADHWLYHELTGADVGCDCEFELSENDRWFGDKIECQVKGTRRINELILVKSREVSFPLEVKTINYGIGKPNAFVLLIVDVEDEVIYYQCLQSYFIEHRELFEKLDEDTRQTLNIRIPLENMLSEDDAVLQEYAHARYKIDSSGVLRVVD